MMSFVYPEGSRKLFTNRRQELLTLNFFLEAHLKGVAQHVTVFGPRRIGKTLVMKEFISRVLEAGDEKVIPAYVDLEDICASPETFVVGYIGMILYWFWEKGDVDPTGYFSPISLMRMAANLGPKESLSSLELVITELERQRPNWQSLLASAFNFPEILARSTNKKLVLCLDEFQAIEGLTSYPDMKGVVSLFRGTLDKQSNVYYVLAGSAVSAMNRMVAEHRSPLFGQFDKIIMGSFSEEDTIELVRKLLPEFCSIPIAKEVFRLTGGRPYYIRQVCTRVQLLHELEGLDIDPNLVKSAFVVETLSKDGKIYDFCRYQYDVSLERARGFAALQHILRILAESEDGQTVATLARKLRVSHPTAGEYVRSLIDVDLVVRRDRQYFFADTVLRYWLANVTKGIELEGFPSKIALEELLARLQEQVQGLSEELGVSKESQLRELMQHFDGQKVPGNILGCEGDVILPRFKKVDHYHSDDGQVEVDCLASDGETWAVELKWKRKAVGLKEIEKFRDRVYDLADLIWIISKSGFTREAAEFCRKGGIYFSDGIAMKRLAGIVGYMWR